MRPVVAARGARVDACAVAYHGVASGAGGSRWCRAPGVRRGIPHFCTGAARAADGGPWTEQALYEQLGAAKLDERAAVSSGAPAWPGYYVYPWTGRPVTWSGLVPRCQ